MALHDLNLSALCDKTGSSHNGRSVLHAVLCRLSAFVLFLATFPLVLQRQHRTSSPSSSLARAPGVFASWYAVIGATFRKWRSEPFFGRSRRPFLRCLHVPSTYSYVRGPVARDMVALPFPPIAYVSALADRMAGKLVPCHFWETSSTSPQTYHETQRSPL